MAIFTKVRRGTSSVVRCVSSASVAAAVSRVRDCLVVATEESGRSTRKPAGLHLQFARAYADAARRLKGEAVEMTIPAERKSLLGMLFGRRAA